MRDLILPEDGLLKPDRAPKSPGVADSITAAAGALPAGQRPRDLLESIAAYLATETADADEVKRKTFPRGHVLIEQGKPPEKMYVLLKGSVYIVQHKGPDKVNKLRDLEAPNLVGEVSLFTGETTADVIVDEDVEVLEIPAIVGRKMLKKEVLLEQYTSLVNKRLLDAQVTDGTEAFSDVALHELEKEAGRATGLIKSVLEGFVRAAKIHPNRMTLLRQKTFAQNEVIFKEDRQGMSSKEAYVVLEGDVRIDKWSPQARASVYLGTYGPGSVVGEQAVLDRRKGRSATVQATGPVRTLVVRQELLEELLRDDEEFADAMKKLGHERRGGRRDILNKATKERGDTPSDMFGASKETLPAELTLQLAEATTREQLFGVIGTFNMKNKLLPGAAWTILHRNDEGVVTFDHAGKLYFQELTQKSARGVLAMVKLRTEGKNRSADNTNAYQMRQECVRRDPTIPTHEAFIWGAPPPMKEADFRESITTKLNWLPQRLALHKHLEEAALEEARSLSQRVQKRVEALGMPGPVLIMMKGNTGAGKSTTVRTKLEGVPDFGIIDEAGGTVGVINPDELKNPLRADAKLDEHHTVTHSQVFCEGAARGFSVISSIMKEKLNIVVDKRFCTPREVDGVVKEAKQNGYRSMVVIDVDAEGETSINRVYGDEQGNGGRNPEGDDPIVPLEAITTGFRDTRESRAAIIDNLKKEKAADGGLQVQYYLFKTDYATPPPGQRLPPKLVATMSKDAASVSPVPEEEARYADLTREVTKEEMLRLNGLLLAREQRRKTAA